jgi:hypothetical protein
VIVNVADLPAVCHNLTCDFTYIESVGEITSFLYRENTRILTIEGTNFPTDVADLQGVIFAAAGCKINAEKLTATTLECELEKEPTCGDWKPTVITQKGNIPEAAELATQRVLCTITSIYPATAFNLLGHDNITLSGTNFPHDLSTSEVVITFNDDQSTPCAPQSSATDTLVCLTDPFNRATAAG